MAGKITALVAQKRNKERVNVYIDGEFAFGLALIEALKLHKGQTLTDEEIDRLKALDEVEVAHERALNLLSYRPRSTDEVRRKLQESNKFSENAVDKALEKLERAGLLDDEAFARYWVENRERFSPRSARALRHELRQKGVSDRVVEDAVTSLDEEDAAYRAAQAKLSRYANAEEDEFRKKLGGYLSRRGFSYGTVRDVLDRIWNEIHTQTNSL
ncbi:MAG TPA: RecX family transcriptional regulator [Aggregatilineales bacterium]|nr:RecX family transcriptional regulator [Aggregatilineales bacterium]